MIIRIAKGLGSAVALTLLLAACDIGEITPVETQGWRDAADAPQSWDEVVADPVALDVTAYVTGEVLAGPGILIDPDVEGVPAEYAQDIWVPAISYLVTHPSGKRVLLDAGLKAGDCSYSVVMVISIGCRNVVGQDVVTQLAADDIDSIDYIFISHFHGDHASGLEQVLARYDPVVLTTDAELDGIQSMTRELAGYKRNQLAADMRVETMDTHLLAMQHLKAADLFGDGSLWLLSTPGHTAGHASALLNTPDGPTVLTFDAAHLEATYTYTAPGGLWYDVEAGAQSIEGLKSLAASLAGARVLFGHEPTQWAPDTHRVALTSSTTGE